MKTSKILKAINDMSTDELIQLNNLYAQSINSEDEIYENDEEFFDIFFENKVNEALRAAHFGQYNWNEKYVKFNGYGNLDSFDYFEIKDLCELPQVIAEYVHENFSEFEHLF